VWRWEHGTATPERAAQYALAGELDVDQALVEAHGWPGWLLMVDPDEPTGGAWTPASAATVLDRVVSSAAMDRRGFLLLSGTAATNLAMLWNGAPPAPAGGAGPGRVTPEVLGHLDSRLAALWRLDDLLGGGAVLDAGIADLRLVARLIRHGSYGETTGLRLWSLAAGIARFCGWAAFDAGREAAAQRFWHCGLRAAAAGGDVDQGVYVLSNLALQAAYSGDGAAAIGLLDVARRRVDPAARTVLAMLDCWAVRGHAVAGNAKAVSALLNQADDMWDQRAPEDDPGWVYWMPQPSLTAEAGTSLLSIGDLAAAERCLTAGLATLDGDSARDRNLYLVRLAETQLRAGRLDEAAATTREAIDAAAGIDSIRVQHRVEDLLDELPAAEPVTAELRDYRCASSPVATTPPGKANSSSP
jgi:tetratricopeptide (TPR) repeat protein